MLGAIFENMFDANSQITELLKLVEITDGLLGPFGPPPFRSFTYTNGKFFVFKGVAAYVAYDSFIKQLYSIKKAIESTFSFDAFETKFHAIFREIYNDPKLNTPAKIADFLQSIISIPKKIFTVVRTIHGVELLESARKLQLGKFTIASFNRYKKEIEAKTTLNSSIFWQFWEGDYIVWTDIEARNHQKANEIANDQFYQLELVVYYAIGVRTENYRVGIVSQIENYTDQSLVISEDNVSQPSKRHGIFSSIILDEPHFRDPASGNDMVWSLIQDSQNNAIKRRILYSVEWVGKACKESDIKIAFLEYMIAIETLLGIQEKHLISPSVANSIIESLVLIISEKLDERLNVEKLMKHLYSIRSGIAHGGGKQVTSQNLTDISFIAGVIIRKFLLHPDLKNLTSTDQLTEVIKKLKYS